MIVIVGESGSGKSTIAKELAKNYGYENVVSYTTRPMRQAEKNHIDYHFVDDEFFIKNDKTIILKATYRGWKYGIDARDLNDKSVMVLTPSGLRELKSQGINFTSIYLNVPRRDRLIKLLQRGDDIEEAYRRSLSDVGQFDGVENEVQYVINNPEYKKSVKKLIEEMRERGVIVQ